MSTTNEELQIIINKLLSVSKQIQAGERGKDFCIETEIDGIDQYDYTVLETEFEKNTRKLLGILNTNSNCLTRSNYLDIKKAFDNSSKAKDSFRGRTPAFGGDWQDIESLVKSESSYAAYVLKEIGHNLKKNGHPEFKDVPDDIIDEMY